MAVMHWHECHIHRFLTAFARLTVYGSGTSSEWTALTGS